MPQKDPCSKKKFLKRFFYGKHSILSEILVSYVQIVPRGPEIWHFKIVCFLCINLAIWNFSLKIQGGGVPFGLKFEIAQIARVPGRKGKKSVFYPIPLSTNNPSCLLRKRKIAAIEARKDQWSLHPMQGPQICTNIFIAGSYNNLKHFIYHQGLFINYGMCLRGRGAAKTITSNHKGEGSRDPESHPWLIVVFCLKIPNFGGEKISF